MNNKENQRPDQKVLAEYCVAVDLDHKERVMSFLRRIVPIEAQDLLTENVLYNPDNPISTLIIVVDEGQIT